MQTLLLLQRWKHFLRSRYCVMIDVYGYVYYFAFGCVNISTQYVKIEVTHADKKTRDYITKTLFSKQL